jgi:hypothetical protein
MMACMVYTPHQTLKSGTLGRAGGTHRRNENYIKGSEEERYMQEAISRNYGRTVQ